jgi:thymidine kinase
MGKDAPYSQRLDNRGVLSKYNDKTIQVGGANEYFPRCIEHFVKPI